MLAVIATAPSKSRPAAARRNPELTPSQPGRLGNADWFKLPSLKRRAAPPPFPCADCLRMAAHVRHT